MTLHVKKPVVYVTRDIERALGIEPKSHNWGDYFVISNDGKFAREIKKKHPDNVWLIKKSEVLDTYDLLALPEVEEIILKLNAETNANILVFQNTPRIERLTKEKGWNLLNPTAELAKEVEEKISQVKWLGVDAQLLPPHEITKIKNVKIENKKLVLQFNHSHTGQGTYVIENFVELKKLQEKFPDRECRVTDFIDGPVFTVNITVFGREILIGNPSYQITGLYPFTDLPFSTIGNDFALPHNPKYKKVYEKTKEIAETVGKKLSKSLWKGLFGIDVIYDEKSGKTYLLEINARQPASVVFESKLQKENTVFETHIFSLLGLKNIKPKNIVSGAQIVKRVTKKSFSIDINTLCEKKLNVIEYENSEQNKELFRIQSDKGIMEKHGELNDLGKFIESCIK
jgi:predicted ATP-grasp superfamily ATP-dependent carboligase